mmetsp:Transcript_8640/g.20755  ORF Transcript_8640/g.20755 Transcript_8640/m.20755 type:complete len:389 (-) Transcript_8640:85-1251(-)|eukprot:CAMPEP_0113628614 /NCGR_PEP_ID=MMETSP0017_2-20120614/14828_1 /TAXON_ID=2856 /ORGANISM="Cylindrotheca closterium" /LENGTH=388 /DNA_ID=CAMNT_0000538929 /DNA_START=84 /DNA_END=1250 /DNA_ORIENTATION=- /assembly_acc=CAM_ASM_000147
MNFNDTMMSNAAASSDLENIPSELLLGIANSMLNPAEQARLSSCSQHFQQALPQYLRVKIVCSRDNGAIQQDLFVSLASAPDKFLSTDDNLVFCEEYYFWSFDYERGNKTFLGRHTRHAHEPDANGRLQYLYTVGLRPCTPNQTWKVVGGNSGDVVMWGEEIALTVGGLNPKPRQPDSNQRGTLCCMPKLNGPCWIVLDGGSGEASKLKLLPCNQYIPSTKTPEKELIVHAIPRVCDEGEYLLHSPCSTMHGSIHSDGFHVIVDFTFWISKGVMYFGSPVLPFALGIPILETDVLDHASCPLANLLHIKSARWGCVIYYMAVAADVGEGKSLNMERFLQRVTEHRDHQVIVNESKDLVYINVLHKQVKTKAKPIPRNDDALWRFILSW